MTLKASIARLCQLLYHCLNLSYINLLAPDDINASGKFVLEVLQVRIALNEHTVGAVDISSGGHCAINSYTTYGILTHYFTHFDSFDTV